MKENFLIKIFIILGIFFSSFHITNSDPIDDLIGNKGLAGFQLALKNLTQVIDEIGKEEEVSEKELMKLKEFGYYLCRKQIRKNPKNTNFSSDMPLGIKKKCQNILDSKDKSEIEKEITNLKNTLTKPKRAGIPYTWEKKYKEEITKIIYDFDDFKSEFTEKLFDTYWGLDVEEEKFKEPKTFQEFENLKEHGNINIKKDIEKEMNELPLASNEKKGFGDEININLLQKKWPFQIKYENKIFEIIELNKSQLLNTKKTELIKLLKKSLTQDVDLDNINDLLDLIASYLIENPTEQKILTELEKDPDGLKKDEWKVVKDQDTFYIYNIEQKRKMFDENANEFFVKKMKLDKVFTGKTYSKIKNPDTTETKSIKDIIEKHLKKLFPKNIPWSEVQDEAWNKIAVWKKDEKPETKTIVDEYFEQHNRKIIYDTSKKTIEVKLIVDPKTTLTELKNHAKGTTSPSLDEKEISEKIENYVFAYTPVGQTADENDNRKNALKNINDHFEELSPPLPWKTSYNENTTPPYKFKSTLEAQQNDIKQILMKKDEATPKLYLTEEEQKEIDKLVNEYAKFLATNHKYVIDKILPGDWEVTGDLGSFKVQLKDRDAKQKEKLTEIVNALKNKKIAPDGIKDKIKEFHELHEMKPAIRWAKNSDDNFLVIKLREQGWILKEEGATYINNKPSKGLKTSPKNYDLNHISDEKKKIENELKSYIKEFETNSKAQATGTIPTFGKTLQEHHTRIKIFQACAELYKTTDDYTTNAKVLENIINALIKCNNLAQKIYAVPSDATTYDTLKKTTIGKRKLKNLLKKNNNQRKEEDKKILEEALKHFKEHVKTLKTFKPEEISKIFNFEEILVFGEKIKNELEIIETIEKIEKLLTTEITNKTKAITNLIGNDTKEKTIKYAIKTTPTKVKDIEKLWNNEKYGTMNEKLKTLFTNLKNNVQAEKKKIKKGTEEKPWKDKISDKNGSNVRLTLTNVINHFRSNPKITIPGNIANIKTTFKAEDSKLVKDLIKDLIKDLTSLKIKVKNTNNEITILKDGKLYLDELIQWAKDNK